MVLGESWTVLAVSDGGVCSFDRGKTAAAAGIAGANGRLRVCRSNAGVHVRGGDRGLGDGDLVGRGRTGTRRNRGQGAPGRARGAEHKATKAVQLISMDGQPCCFLVGGGRRQATGRGGLAMVLREEGEAGIEDVRALEMPSSPFGVPLHPWTWRLVRLHVHLREGPLGT